MIQFSFDVSVIVLLEFHQPIRSSASGAALANQKLSCRVPLLLEQLWPLRSSASGAALANQKLSCWVPLGTVTGFHTKPPIMPYFSGFHSVLFIIRRFRAIQSHSRPESRVWKQLEVSPCNYSRFCLSTALPSFYDKATKHHSNTLK